MQKLKISEKRFQTIKPLEQWEVLGLTELYHMSESRVTFSAFCRGIKRLENDKILSSFTYPLDNIQEKRKFLFLTKEAHFELLGTEKPYLDLNIKIHEAILFNVLKGFSSHPLVGHATPHSKTLFTQRGFMDSKVDSDGVITAKIKGESLYIALEIERFQKNSTEVFRKFKDYYHSENYDIAIYMFSSKRIRNRYARYHTEFLKNSAIDQDDSMMLFCYSDEMHKIDFNPMDTLVINNKEQEVPLSLFFV